MVDATSDEFPPLDFEMTAEATNTEVVQIADPVKVDQQVNEQGADVGQIEMHAVAEGGEQLQPTLHAIGVQHVDASGEVTLIAEEPPVQMVGVDGEVLEVVEVVPEPNVTKAGPELVDLVGDDSRDVDFVASGVVGGERVDEDDVVLVTGAEEGAQRRNSGRRRLPPKRLSPSPPRNRGGAEKKCKRAGCDNVGPRNWYTGPDGNGTLCHSCYMRYRFGRLVVYMDEDSGRLSIIQQGDMVAMRVIGFEPRDKGSGMNDLSRPKVVRLGNAPQDLKLLETSKRNGKSGRRERVIVESGPKKRKRVGDVAANEQRESAEVVRRRRPLSELVGEHEGLFVKVEWRNDLRRFRMPIGVSLHAFREEIRRVFEWRSEQLFCVTFMDEKGDFVRLGEETKMKVMYGMIERCQMTVLRIRIVS